MNGQVLVVMMGLPGTGKSAIAEGIARAISAPVFSVDPLEATLNRAGITREHRSDYAAYDLAGMLARSHLALGQSAIVDAANWVEVSRAWWRDIAVEFGVRRCVVECVCSSRELHLARLNTRERDLPGFLYEPRGDHSLIERFHAEYEPCSDVRLVLDGVDPLDENIRKAIAYVRGAHDTNPTTPGSRDSA
jgi:predicted kinase